jgi:flagellar assembly protein FliH
VIPVIKASRLAEAGVALRRHPRLMRGPGKNPEQVPAAPTVSAQAPVIDDDKVIAAADAAAYVAGELVCQDPGAEDYDNGFEEGQRTGWGAGHEEGLRDGLQKGREDADAAARVQADALEALGAAIKEACTQRRAALEAGAIEIAYAAVLRLIGESAGNRTVVADTVRRVLEQLPDRTLQCIRVSPADHALLQHGAHGLNLSGALLVADERVELGGCIVDTDAGSLDGRLETQLSELKTLLVELHQSHQSHEAQP